MINRVTAAFLILLAIIIWLGHSIISHHHHDYLAVEISSQSEFDDKHSHHGGNANHDHKPVEDEHDNPSKKHHEHSFPQHSHASISSDFNFTLLNQSISLKQFNQPIIITFYESGFCDIHCPPDFEYDYGNSKFRITSLFEPGAIALRGPPTIG